MVFSTIALILDRSVGAFGFKEVQYSLVKVFES